VYRLSGGRACDHAGQVSWINSSYRDTRPSSSGHRSADRHCACRRLPCFTEFACPERQLVVLPIGFAYATQMLVFVRSEGRRNQRPNGRPLSHWAQGLLRPSQHDQAIALTIALHLCLPLTPQRSAQLCKERSLLKHARDRRPMSRSRPRLKTMRQLSVLTHAKQKPRTHCESDPVRKQVRRHKLTPKRPERMTLKSHRRMQYLELWRTLHRLTTPPLRCPTTTLRGLPVAASRPLTSSRRYSFSLSQSP
jgi:hypothetical protein